MLLACFHANVGLEGEPGASFCSTHLVRVVRRSTESAPLPPPQCCTAGSM